MAKSKKRSISIKGKNLKVRGSKKAVSKKSNSLLNVIRNFISGNKLLMIAVGIVALATISASAFADECDSGCVDVESRAYQMISANNTTSVQVSLTAEQILGVVGTGLRGSLRIVSGQNISYMNFTMSKLAQTAEIVDPQGFSVNNFVVRNEANVQDSCDVSIRSRAVVSNYDRQIVHDGLMVLEGTSISSQAAHSSAACQQFVQALALSGTITLDAQNAIASRRIETYGYQL